MVDQQKLTSVLGEFARTLVTDFPIQGILDHLVERMVEVLPVTSAGVTLISPGLKPRYIAASHDDALRFESLQTELGEGPCLAAYETGEAVSVPDLRVDQQFPAFSPRAMREGAVAVFTFPLRGEHGRLGALDLYRDTVGPLAADASVAAQTLADVATAYLLNAQARADALQASDRYRESALHDALTGLPNRVLLGQRLEHAALRAQRSHTAAAVLFADIDDFKSVNDLYGHQAGDELLVAFAHRLDRLLRSGDTLARLGGDEFVIVCEDLTDASHADTLAARIAKALTEPFLLSAAEIWVTASMGIAFAGPGEHVSAGLIQDADVAMRRAKRGGASHRSESARVTAPGPDGAGVGTRLDESGPTTSRMGRAAGNGGQILDLRQQELESPEHVLEQDLRSAFAEDRLDVAYQPIVRSIDGQLTGFEALLRWTDPHRGPVPAQVTIATAEQLGLIDQIGAWVLDRACRDQQEIRAADHGGPLMVTVNVSPTQLMSPGFTTTVASVLDQTKIDPAFLVLEMTENILIEDPERALLVLTDLKDMNLSLALEHFGTAYSSLSYLQFPIDIVKIDREFVAGLAHHPSSRAIMRAITNLCHELGMTVTAEGVETRRQHDQIIDLGCESAQGYYYARPMPASELAERLHEPSPLPLRLPTQRTPASSRAT
ncbi:MAG: putative bifunctional diguanylate cyclase/phosphodiesterase [Actinomycetes bacterium]